MKTESLEKKSTFKDASSEIQVDKHPSAVNSNESEASQDDKSDEPASFENNTIQGANIMVRPLV